MPKQQEEAYEGDKDQYLVKTPYGRGLVVRTRTAGGESLPIREIRLLDWDKAVKAGQKKAGAASKAPKTAAILYSTIDYDSVDIQQGDDVQTIFGRGRVLNVVSVKIRSSSNRAQEVLVDQQSSATTPLNGTELHGLERQITKYQIQLTSWRLAGRSTVKCFLFNTPKSPIRVLRKKTLTEMNARERVDFAQRQKASAIQVFALKKYQQALNIYAGAVDAVRYVQYDSDSSNECRADLVEVMVTCSNNAATCCVQLQKWSDAQRYAQNALVLLDALYSKRGMKIHSILTKHTPGLCDAKLFGEWRVKSYMIIARALGEKEEYNEALETLKKTRDIITLYTTGDDAEQALQTKAGQESIVKLKTQEREVVRLNTAFVEKKKDLLRKEKAAAQAMFAPHASDSLSDSITKIPSLGSVDSHTSTSDLNPSSNIVPSPSPRTATPPLSVLKSSSKGQLSSSYKNPPIDSTATSNSNPKPDSKPKHTPKRVSFADKLEDTCILDDEMESSEMDPWYVEHKEALLLLALGGLASLSFFVMRRK